MNQIKLLIKYLNENFLTTKILNPKDIYQPIVDVVKSIPRVVRVDNFYVLSDRIKEWLEPILKKIADKEYPKMPEFPKEMKVSNPEDFKTDFDGVLSEISDSLKAIREKETVFNAPEVTVSVETEKLLMELKSIGKKIPAIKDPKDYTKVLEEVVKAVKAYKATDVSKIEAILERIAEKGFPKELIEKGRIKVSIKESMQKFFDSSGGYGMIVNKQSQQINPATEEKQDAIIGNYALKLVEVGSVTYLGKAAIGSATSAAVWQVKKIDETTGIVITWADGNSLFDNVFDDYLTLSYA